MKKISIIAAIDEKNGIGKNNALLWHIPADLKRFKKLTSGNVIIMGHKTWLSLPFKPLPNRRNIVISRNRNLQYQGCEIVHSVEMAMECCNDETENFVIGGGEIYEFFLPYVQKLYITQVHKTYNSDTFFPEIKPEEWEQREKEDFEQTVPESLKFSYISYHRI